ncbi:MAG: phosphoenolpyruvate--protein phosphotransferase [Verrucomicrobiales bacterium]
MNDLPREEIRVRGPGISPGLVIGPAHFSTGFFVEPESIVLPAEAAESELVRFRAALASTRKQLQALLRKAAGDSQSDNAGIFEAHLLMAEDPALLKEVERAIVEEHFQAEGAFYRVMQRYMDAMRRFDDEYLRERVTDLADVTRRVLGNMGGPCAVGPPGFQHILVAHDLAPSETVEIDRTLVLGFATEAGSQTSHTAILARSLGIPAVVGLHDLHSHVRSGDIVLLDGHEGTLIVHPSPDTIATYEAAHRRRARVNQQLHAMREGDATTRDGQRVIVAANIELAEEMGSVMAQGAEGVGLYRTEFLFLGRDDWPDEEEQAKDYICVAQQAGEHGVIFRTLDVGGDKLPAGDDWAPEDNPFLGWRGIRRSLQQPERFKTQLRAILRASAHGKVRLMYPLVSGRQELIEANALLSQCQEELRAQGMAFDEGIERGAMIEVPGAAIMADALADEVDFFSVGTNDLVQYTIAVDRGNERVASLYEPWHPAILRLLKNVVDAVAKTEIWVGVCGEMAGDIIMTPLLVGLGFSELSVGAHQLPRVKHAVRTLYAAECRTLVERVLKMHNDHEIFGRSREMARTYYAELLE